MSKPTCIHLREQKKSGTRMIQPASSIPSFPERSNSMFTTVLLTMSYSMLTTEEATKHEILKNEILECWGWSPIKRIDIVSMLELQPWCQPQRPNRDTVEDCKVMPPTQKSTQLDNQVWHINYIVDYVCLRPVTLIYRTVEDQKKTGDFFPNHPLSVSLCP